MPEDRSRIAVAMMIPDLPISFPETFQLLHNGFMPAVAGERNVAWRMSACRFQL
jgi:hypothetical protein